MAEEETKRYTSETKGKYEAKYLNEMGYVGQNELSSISEKADATNEVDYNALMRQMERAYLAGKKGTSLATITDDIVGNYGFDKADVEKMYEAGKRDSEGSGYSVRIESTGEGNGYSLKNTHETRKALKSIADTFGVNVVLTDDISKYSDGSDSGTTNGLFNHETNTVYLNNADATRNLGYTLVHELTHNMSKYAVDDYRALVNTFSEMWQERNPEQYKVWTDRVRERYAKSGQNLTDEQVMEEILCDQMGEILHDEDFMGDLVEEHRSVAQIFLDLIKNAIRRMKEMFGLGDVFDSRFEDATLSEYNLLKDAEAFLTKAIHEKKIRDALEGKRTVQTSETNTQKSNIDNSYSYESDAEYQLPKTAYARWIEKARSGDSFPTTSDGLKIIETGDSDWVNNILVYTDVSTGEPEIDSILVMESSDPSKELNETILSKIRSDIYELEQSGRAAFSDVVETYGDVVFSRIEDNHNGTFRKIRRFNAWDSEGRRDVNSAGKGSRRSNTSTNGVSTRGRSGSENSGVEQGTGQEISGAESKQQYSLDISEADETEDRGWDLPEALEEQLIAELESSYAEDEEVPGDVYIDGEAKDYVEIFGENDKEFYALSGVELHNELAEQMKSGSQVFIPGTSFEQKQGARESATAYTEDGKALRGEILTNVNVENFDRALDNGVNWVDKAYIYARTEEGVDYVLPVVVAEEGGHYKFIAS